MFDSTYHTYDKHCIPNYEDSGTVLRFPDGQKAGALICYWGVVLELLSTKVDIQVALSGLITPTPDAAMHVIEMCQDMVANRVKADETAALILQSLPYLFCCLEGVFVAQLPLKIAKRYFARRANRRKLIFPSDPMRDGWRN